MSVKLYDKNGNAKIFSHAVDAQEGLSSGVFFKSDPTQKAAPEPAAEHIKKTIEEIQKESKVIIPDDIIVEETKTETVSNEKPGKRNPKKD